MPRHDKPEGWRKHRGLDARDIEQAVELRLTTAIRERETMAAMDAMDLLSWSREFLPNHFRLPPSAMHRWLAEQLDAMRGEYNRDGNCQPRERAIQNRHGRKVNVVGP